MALFTFLFGCGENERQSLFQQKDGAWYFDSTLIADAATFRYLKSEYAKDRAHLYFEGVLFPAKDVETFQLLEDGFARDRLSGYYHQRPVPGSDGATFSALDGHYSKEGKNVLYSYLEPAPGEPLRKTIRVAGADATSFAVLDPAATAPTPKIAAIRT